MKDKAIKLKFSSESPWHGWITSALGEFMSEFYPWIIKKDNFNSRALNLPLAVEFMHSIIMFRNIQLICTSQKPFKGEKKNLDLIFIFLLAKFAWEFCKVEIHNQNNFCVQRHIDCIWRLTGNYALWENSIIQMNQMAPLPSQKVKTLANSSCRIYCLEIKLAMYSKTLHLHVTAL